MDWLARRATDIVLVIAGTVFLVVGLTLLNAQRPIEGGVNTTGTIVDHVVKTDSDDSTSTYPIIEFRDQQGRTHRFENEIGGGGFGIEGKIGQVVEVRYDPQNPSRAQWLDQPGQWVPVLAVGVGIVLLLVELGVIGRRVLRGRSAASDDPEAAYRYTGDDGDEGRSASTLFHDDTRNA